MDYLALLVSQDFFQGSMPGIGSANNAGNISYSDIWGTTLEINRNGVSSPGVNYSKIATSIHKKGPDVLEKLENGKCHKIFNNNYVPDYSSVILMTNVTTARNSLLAIDVHWSAAREESVEWFGDTIDTAHWYLGYDNHGTKNGSGGLKRYSYTSSNGTVVHYYSEPSGLPSLTANATVEYCSGQKVTQYCTVELFPGLLWTVIFCNLIKVACFIALLYIRFTPLITVGDAVASFLAYPDITTEGLGPCSARDSKECNDWKRNKPSVRWHSRRYRWFRGATKQRWIWTILM